MTDDDLDAHIREHADPDAGGPLGCMIVLAGLVYLTAAGLLFYHW